MTVTHGTRVGVRVGSGVFVGVFMGVDVSDGMLVGVFPGVDVLVGLDVAVLLGGTTGVLVGVWVGVWVGVLVRVAVGPLRGVRVARGVLVGPSMAGKIVRAAAKVIGIGGSGTMGTIGL
jgi:hypothetical protein